LVYHLVVAFFGIALLLCGWVWVQRRAAREGCKGLADEAVCVIGTNCHGCVRAADAKIDSTNGNDATVNFEPSDRERPHYESQAVK